MVYSYSIKKIQIKHVEYFLTRKFDHKKDHKKENAFFFQYFYSCFEQI